MCVEGALRVSHELVDAIPDPTFRCYYVWLPVLMADSQQSAGWNEVSMRRKRARHYWDPELAFARHLGGALDVGDTQAPDGTKTNGVAWDVYLLYGRGAKDVTRPDFWMHQLDVKTAPRLDASVLRTQALEMLQRS